MNYQELLFLDYKREALLAVDPTGSYSLSIETMRDIVDMKVTPRYSYGFSFRILEEALQALVNEGQLGAFYCGTEYYHRIPATI
jgi:hypothetical protein